MVDLKHAFSQGMNSLLTWRQRYPLHEYGEKVLLNVFYRKYTMEFMWNAIINNFQVDNFGRRKVIWDDFNTGFAVLKQVYGRCAMEKTQPVLLDLLENNPEQDVGNISYSSYAARIEGAARGKQEDIEEIEYAYLFYLLTDECVLLWSAFGGTGLDQAGAIRRMTGVVLEPSRIETYTAIEGILSRFCAAPYLGQVYKPLPPLLGG